ncbi:DUF3365 domain-containing protein [Aestuariibacter sp. GS-14]|uniref:Tll0287-like domain-containing protein n=1 Tax=Aestuariibacter sp. GS-14 TaxID=2590670 RepID=UPI001126FE70|nr:DUF3365 domain-containing protein [Aestuariibacter sp. GS-14]TPV58500.1 DUF3365 domain-containing protein [Aestuariibacter sp. GS-14]
MTNKVATLWVLAAVFSASTIGSIALAETLSEAEFIDEAKVKSMALGAELKQALQAAIKQGGLTEGIRVCKELAPQLAAKYSVNGWQVGRTSLKVRNPNNAPDGWETEALIAMENALANGGAPMQAAQAHTGADLAEWRYMQPIVTQAVCLNCHGAQLTPDVSQTLQVHYPEDQATGFEDGQLRGAFTLRYQRE